MDVTADSIRHLTRAYIGARVYQGLLFWLVLVQNITAALTDLGNLSPRPRIWLTLGGVLAAATLGTCYRWRFGRVEAPRPTSSRRLFEDFKYGGGDATSSPGSAMTISEISSRASIVSKLR